MPLNRTPAAIVMPATVPQHGTVVARAAGRCSWCCRRGGVVSPVASSASAADPAESADHLSAGYLVALAGRLVREVGALARRAGASGKRLPTLTIDTQIGFRSAADRAAFADALTAAVLDLAARYHHDDGRPHRLLVAAHPLPEESP
jgi:hypothetical protein